MDYDKRFTEDEAFAHAKRFYEDSFVSDVPRYHESRHVVSDLEQSLFRPALELQVAGLCLGAGRPQNELILPVSFAFFVVDHLTMGWAASLVSQFRVAYTLSRSAVEASIFEVASVTDPAGFRKLWGTSGGTGGNVLKQLGSKFPRSVKGLLDIAWKFSVAFGHASLAPVMSPVQLVKAGETKRFRVTTFGGPYIPLNEDTLLLLASTYALAAQAGLQAMATSLAPHFPQRPRWDRQYCEFRKQTEGLADSAVRKLQDEENNIKPQTRSL